MQYNFVFLIFDFAKSTACSSQRKQLRQVFQDSVLRILQIPCQSSQIFSTLISESFSSSSLCIQTKVSSDVVDCN